MWLHSALCLLALAKPLRGELRMIVCMLIACSLLPSQCRKCLRTREAHRCMSLHSALRVLACFGRTFARTAARVCRLLNPAERGPAARLPPPMLLAFAIRITPDRPLALRYHVFACGVSAETEKGETARTAKKNERGYAARAAPPAPQGRTEMLLGLAKHFLSSMRNCRCHHPVLCTESRSFSSDLACVASEEVEKISGNRSCGPIFLVFPG